MKRLLYPLLLATSLQAQAQDVIRFYSWKDYFDPAVLKDFEAQTGIRVDYQAYTTVQELDQALRQHPERHALIALHHQAVPVGCAWLDQHNLKNADDLFAVLARHPQQKTILFGHVHQEFDEVHRGVRLIASPSTCIQFKPLSDGFALDESGPGWRYLTLHPDGRIASQVWRLPVGQFVPDPDATGY